MDETSVVSIDSEREYGVGRAQSWGPYIVAEEKIKWLSLYS